MDKKTTIRRLISVISVFLLIYTIYAIKQHMWPCSNLPYERYSLFHIAPSFWYAFIYTVLVVVFGIPAYKRWGRKDNYQRYRYLSFLFFQIIFFFFIPEVFLRLILKWQDYGKAYELQYPWPLSWNVFFDNPPLFYIVWGCIMSFIAIPIIVRWHGVRYCSWICGCGALAETVGDRWRHLMPKGKKAEKWEVVGTAILIAACIITIGVVMGIPGFNILRRWYSATVDLWLVGIIPLALYPFLGGKIWCRFCCPLAKAMHLLSRWYGTLKISANKDCIACGTCNKYCQVGVDVMKFAKEGSSFSSKNSSCIGCGICVSTCPKGVLRFEREKKKRL